MNINSLYPKPTSRSTSLGTGVPTLYKSSNIVSKYDNTNDKGPIVLYNSNSDDVKEQILYLQVSSKERISGTTSQFTIEIPEGGIENIHSIELINAIIPNNNSVLDEPYLLLNIAELRENFKSNDTFMSNAFTMMTFSLNNTSLFAYLKKISRDVSYEKIFYNSPKASLNKMSISILKPDGTPFNFTNPSSTDITDQVSFIFRIINLNKKPLDYNFI